MVRVLKWTSDRTPQSIHFCGNLRSRNSNVKIKARCSILLGHCVIRTLFFQHQIGMRNSSDMPMYTIPITNHSTLFGVGGEDRPKHFMFGLSAKGPTLSPTYNYWTRNVVPPDSNIMSVKPDRAESTQHNFGCEKLFSSGFYQRSWLNVYWLLAVRLLCVVTICICNF